MNNPKPSEITTLPAEQPSRIGTQLGAHGLATLVGLDDLPPHPHPDLVHRMMDSLQAFSARLPEDQAEADTTREAIRYLTIPAPGKWVAGRVVTLLSHYFIAQQDASVAEAVAEDWCTILEEYPAWAIANAVRWWMGRDNPRKHFKPLPGDIQDRAHVEMQRVRAAQITLSRGIASKRSETEREAVSEEDLAHRAKVSAEVMAAVAERRRMNGASDQ